MSLHEDIRNTNVEKLVVLDMDDLFIQIFNIISIPRITNELQ